MPGSAVQLERRARRRSRDLARKVSEVLDNRRRPFEGGVVFGLSFWEIAMVLAVALLVLGPTKLPELARSLGRGIREFRRATEDFKSTIDDELHKPDKTDLKELPAERKEDHAAPPQVADHFSAPAAPAAPTVERTASGAAGAPLADATGASTTASTSDEPSLEADVPPPALDDATPHDPTTPDAPTVDPASESEPLRERHSTAPVEVEAPEGAGRRDGEPASESKA